LRFFPEDPNGKEGVALYSKPPYVRNFTVFVVFKNTLLPITSC